MEAKRQILSIEEFTANQYGRLMEVYDFAANLPVSQYADTIALRLSEIQYRSSRFVSQHMTFEDYLLNSKKSTIDISLIRGVSGFANYGVRASLQLRRLKEDDYHAAGQAIELPPYRNLSMRLSTAIRSRRSLRDMTTKPATMSDLSTLLFHACGITGDFKILASERGEADLIAVDMDEYSKLRTSPSGGGLYSVYLYIWVQNVTGLEDGIYLYLPLTHSIATISTLSAAERERIQELTNFGPDTDSKNFRFTVFYVYNIFENARKYGDMALILAMIEVGEIAQNIHLACTGMGLASCDIAAFDKVPCEEYLKLDGLSQQLVHLTIIGNK
ncbi:MAG: SagB/ThcOx family dehydrogenase [Propionibacteriaceae bacterium]|nr:SagB/ThcOx family dehydrogenase [Propionibacteriaceae bacterium]